MTFNDHLRTLINLIWTRKVEKMQEFRTNITTQHRWQYVGSAFIIFACLNM